MKKSALHLTALLLFACSFVACKKDNYADQLSGNWKSTEVTLSGLNLTRSFNVQLNLVSDNQFKTVYNVSAPGFALIKENLSGTWQEDSKKQQFTLKYSDGSVEVYQVLELTAEMLTTETNIEDKVLTVTFSQQ